MTLLLQLSVCWFLLLSGEDVAADDAALSRHFGFGPMQIYKLKKGLSELQIADLDADGRSDIALWNRWQNRIELFYQPGAGESPSDPAAALERNEIASRGTMRNESIPVAHRVSTLRVGEFTGDKRVDLIYFGEPRELVILPGREEGGFGPAISMRAPDGDPRTGGLAVGDFNHDGRDDAALRGDGQVLVYYQQDGGGLAKPERLVHKVKQTLLLMSADLNGDGRDDLLMSVDDNEYGMFAFIQGTDGTLGARQRIRIADVRSVTVARNPGAADDVYSVESATNRLRALQWGPAAKGATADWPMLLYSYPVVTNAKRRPLAIGDVTGDGRPDVVVASEDTAQLILFEGRGDGLSTGRAFPGLVKTTSVAVGDLHGDGGAEVISVSDEEKMVGVSHYERERLTFPTALAIAGEPLGVTVGALSAGGAQRVIACVAKVKSDSEESDGGGRRGRGDTETMVFLLDALSGEELRSWPIEALKDDIAGVWLADVNQDGRSDLLIFVQYAPLVTLLQDADGNFAPLAGVDARAGLVNEASPAGAALADIDGDGKAELILAQKNLARALVVRDGQWEVVDQFNPESADAKLTGLAALPDEAGATTIVLYDLQARELLVMKRGEDNTYAVTQTMPVGAFDLTAMRAIKLAGATHDLLLADPQKLALLRPGERAAAMIELQTYETDIKDAWLADAAVGDFNHDGVRDVIAVDMRKANLELLTTMPDGELRKVLHFQVFQGKRFSAEPDAGGEPHEVVAGDVTGDGTDDIVLLAHDRLIIYPGQ